MPLLLSLLLSFPHIGDHADPCWASLYVRTPVKIRDMIRTGTVSQSLSSRQRQKDGSIHLLGAPRLFHIVPRGPLVIHTCSANICHTYDCFS